jgi:ribosome-binding factor A
MKAFKRSKRVADQIKRDASEIISDMNRDSAGLMITISGVEVSDDLKYARVFYTVMGDDAEKIKKAEKFFGRASNRIQNQLARKLHIRKMPELSFHFDKSLLEGLRITALIDKVMTKDNEQKN